MSWYLNSYAMLCSLQVFSRAPVGTRLRLLCGTAQSLVNNIAVVADALTERAPFAKEHVIGSLFFFCGNSSFNL